MGEHNDEWRDRVLRGLPAVELITLSSGNRVWGRTGLCVGDRGMLIDSAKKPLSSEALAQLKAGHGDDWEPASEVLVSDCWSALNCRLSTDTVHGLVDGGHQAPDSKAYLSVSSTSLIGSFVKGVGLVGRTEDGEWTSRNLERAGAVVVFSWPLNRIDKIDVYRARKLRKLWDAEISISSSAPRAIFHSASIGYFGDKRPMAEKSEMVDFAMALATQVNKSRGVSATWAVSTVNDKGDRGESRQISFA